MREFIPAERPEELDHLRDQPVMGLFDEGLQIQNPMRYKVPHQYESGYIDYRRYCALAFPVVETADKAYIAVRDHLFPKGVQGISIGNGFYSDLWDKYPRYLYPSGKLLYVIPATEDQVNVTGAKQVSGNADEAYDLSGRYLDAILRELPVESVLLVGNTAIAGFLAGYIEQSESGAEKRMPSRETEYLLPRVDWDVLTMIVTARMASLPAEQINIPEEHRYRVLLNLTNVLAHYYTESKREYDIGLAPASDFKDEREHKLQLELSTPLHSVMGMLHHTYSLFYDAPYNPSVACILYAYDVRPQELVEITQQIWYAREYWNDLASRISLNALKDHYDQPPEPEHARLFLEGITKVQAAHYNELIQATVLAAADPYRLMVDKR